ALAYSPSGKMLASAGYDGRVLLWSLKKGINNIRPVPLEEFPDIGYSLAFSRDGTLLLVGCADSTARLFDVARREQIQVFEGHTQAVLSVALSPDSRLALTGSGDW